MDLSLCMIARDEERDIRECLETIRPWVDEMVVVDTGSNDRIREIAHACGASVFEFPGAKTSPLPRCARRPAGASLDLERCSRSCA